MIEDSSLGERHHLDPLAPSEIDSARRIAQEAGRLTERTRVVSISLEEPTRAERRDPAGHHVERRARVVALDPDRHLPLEIVVNLTGGCIDDFRELEGMHSPVTLSDYLECELLVRADPRVAAALARRGLDDVNGLQVEAWGLGDFQGPSNDNQRLVWTLLFYRDTPRSNPYARPITGLYCIVDLDTRRVLTVHDGPVVPVPPGGGEYVSAHEGSGRPRLEPLTIAQPNGVSFHVRGHCIEWQGWSLRVGFNAREGLVLHEISYADHGEPRTILDRASIAELVIPYADPRPFEGWRNAFDLGEYGIGITTNSLSLGCDCLGEIRYLDAWLADSEGKPYRVENAVCIHEEDAGVLWKHFDSATGETEVRRSRRLVISFIITAGNYEYAFYWYFYQDASIELEVKLTGIVLTSGLSVEQQPPGWGTVVAPGVFAAHHQHFFSVRLDPAVDGPLNTVVEIDTVPLPLGPDNPYANGFTTHALELKTELSARRRMSLDRGRYWLIQNLGSTNGLGQTVGYKLVPLTNAVPFADHDAPVRRRARFMDYHLWVTRYDPVQRFPAGEYPNQSSSDEGLPEWVRADREIKDQEVVVWYTMGSHHVTRPEDWPVMPCERLGFLLKPVSFFERSPALDVAPPADHCGPSTPGQGSHDS